MRYLVSPVLFAAVLFSAPGLAQQPATAPARDPARQDDARAGSAIVRGRVLAADTGRPLRRARITVVSPELGREPRITSTGLDGRYEITDLPAGRYTIRVERGGYLTLRYGQTRPLEQGMPLDVRERETVERVDFTLPRAGAITGRVVDELGDPISDVQVFAMRTAYWQGRRRLVPSGMVARTDDAGEYRVSGLMPGTYLVMAVLRDTWTVRQGNVDQTFGYAPTYAPGTAVAGEAQRVTVHVGERLGPIDLSLVAGRAANISGIATDAGGRPLAGRFVGLGRQVTGPESGAYMAAGSSSIAADGSFSIRNIPPGQYSLRVQTASAGAGPNDAAEMIVMPITIDGVDITNITLTTAPGWSMLGQIVTEEGIAPRARPGTFGVSVTPVDADIVPDSQANRDPDNGRVLNDWTVRVTGIYGTGRVHARTPDGWWVKSIVQDGRDLADTPAEIRSGETLSGVRIVVSDRPTSVRGRIVDDKGTPVTSATVVAFARDSQKWFEESRWVRAVRPDQQGNYRIDGLPPGEYLAVAIDYVEDGTWNDAAFIESLRDRGEPLTLTEGEARTVTLKLVTP
jgi:protocatechuate 3,4-dioxygenase beta subunit